MKDAERKLFDEMIKHNIKSFTSDDENERERHRKMYIAAKHILWEFQNQEKKNDKSV